MEAEQAINQRGSRREPALRQRGPHRVGLRRVVPDVDVRVIQGLFYRDAALGIDDQHFGQQVACLTRCDGNGAGQRKRRFLNGNFPFVILRECCACKQTALTGRATSYS